MVAAMTQQPAPPTAAHDAPAPRDGRNARAERTRLAVVQAMLDLIGEGDLRPSAARIASRAGVSLRSVFQHFDDMESLLATVAGLQLARAFSDARPVSAELPLPQRIEAFVAQRARLLERISPVRRAALLSEPFSSAVAGRLAWVRRRGRRDAEQVFASELAHRAAADRRDVVDALTVACSWSTWEALRAHQGLSPARARRVIVRTVTALLKEES
jgi:AcrR family transcriptional regulator